MDKNLYRYSVKMTEAYPPDTRIFSSKLIPVLIKFYSFPDEYEKDTALNCFNWGSMYTRDEEYIIGKEGSPRVKLTRSVYGEHLYTDEWEVSTLELVDFCPPHINDTVLLEIECAESLLITDKGTHECTIKFNTDSMNLYEEVLKVIHEILKRFKNAHLEIIED